MLYANKHIHEREVPLHSYWAYVTHIISFHDIVLCLIWGNFPELPAYPFGQTLKLQPTINNVINLNEFQLLLLYHAVANFATIHNVEMDLCCASSKTANRYTISEQSLKLSRLRANWTLPRYIIVCMGCFKI